MITPVSPWASPPEILMLAEGEVHVWRAFLDIPQPQIQALEQILADDERAHAQRFRFSKDRTHLIAPRGLLRTILGRYLLQDPQTLSFSYNAYGKPSLTESGQRATTRVAPPVSGRMKEDALSFNLTHAHRMALYAITHNRAVGVDVEY